MVESSSNNIASQNMVDPELLHKAVDALVKYHETKASENKNLLLGDDQTIHVQFTLNRMPEKGSISSRPIRIKIPHSLHKLNDVEDEENDKLEEIEVCLIVKDSSKSWVKELITQFPKELSYIKKVISLTSLRKKYAQYQDRRTLCNSYKLFLVDDCILPMVGKCIGKTFFQKTKQPVPIKLSRKEALPFTIERCIKSTFLVISPGTCLNVKAASTKMAAKSIEQNIQSVVEHAIPRVPRKASNIASISIKTDTSATLPIYNKVREELNDIKKLAQVESKKGKKRTLDSNEGDEAEEDKLKEEEKKKKQKKEEASLKSPLLKALKKKKKQESEEQEQDKETTTKSKQKKANESKGNQKKKVKENKVTPEAKEENVALKKKKKITVSDTASSKEKSDFIASKKFKGSKKGYVFKKGAKGVGYYIDVKPVPDKMALEAIIRSKGSSGSSGSRRKSIGNSAKKGRRKGRRISR